MTEMTEKENTESNIENEDSGSEEALLKNKVSDDEASSDEDKKGDSETSESDPVSEMKKQLEQAQNQVKEENDRFLRLYADFENYKKRSARDMQDFRKFANEALIKELLPVLDNLERALESSNGDKADQQGIIQGVDMTRKEILKILERFHLKPVEALDKPFDPNYHEAIGQEETEDKEDNIVVKEFQKGYLLHDRLIRPAMVVVSKKKVEIVEPEINQDTQNDHENNDKDE